MSVAGAVVVGAAVVVDITEARAAAATRRPVPISM